MHVMTQTMSNTPVVYDRITFLSQPAVAELVESRKSPGNVGTGVSVANGVVSSVPAHHVAAGFTQNVGAIGRRFDASLRCRPLPEALVDRRRANRNSSRLAADPKPEARHERVSDGKNWLSR